MNPPELIRLAQEVDLDSRSQFRLRISFGVACIERVEHLLTESSVVDAFSVGKAFVLGSCTQDSLEKAAASAKEIARSHPGSGSIDGSGSAAVSTSHGVVAALEGRALVAAEYAAYASVYAYASYAVTDLSAYESEHGWQIETFRELTRRHAVESGR